MNAFPKDLVLDDNRALLRPLEENDLPLLTAFAVNEPDNWPYSHISPAGIQGMEQYVRTAIQQRTAGKEYPFIVFDKRSGACAGSTRFYDIQIEALTTQLGYTWYGKNFQRTGLNRHCKWLLLTYAFETWGLERVEFRADVRNERSIRAMQEIGCIVEGVLRNNLPLPSGDRRSSIVLSILKEEWFGKVKDLLQKKSIRNEMVSPEDISGWCGSG